MSRCQTCTIIEVEADRRIERLSRALDQALQMLPVQDIPQDLQSLYETWHCARHCASEELAAVRAQRNHMHLALLALSGEFGDDYKFSTVEQVREFATKAIAAGSSLLHKPNKPYKSPFAEQGVLDL